MNIIREDIRNQSFRPAYLLYGPEEYLRTAYRNMLLDALVPDRSSMNFSRYAGKDLDQHEIISQAETLPFFADRRVILLEDTGFFKGKADALADYLKNPPDYLVMIFVEEEADKRSRLYKAVQKNGHAAVFEPQNEETLTRWVLTRMTKEGKKITRPVMRHFLETTGTDMANIASELEKLLCYTMGREVITAADIDAICVPQTTDQVFEMVRAVAERRQKDALNYYYDLLALKVPPMRTLFLLVRQFNQLLQIKALDAEGQPRTQIASRVGVPPFVVTKSMGLVRKYSAQELQAILQACAQTEEDVKTGRLDDRLGVEMLIVQFSSGKRA